MATLTSTKNIQQQRRRSLGAVVAGISLASTLALGSGLNGLLPGLGSQAGAASTLTGLVYLDLNGNGAQNLTTDGATNERGIANVTVTAYTTTGTNAGTATTLLDGTWRIATPADGPFRVEFTNVPDQRLGSGNNLGGTSVQFPVGANNINFSLFGKVDGLGNLEDLNNKGLQIGNRLWRDTNANGVQDPGEPGINGVIVRLVDEAGAPAVNVFTGAPLADVTTSGDGEYYFDNLTGPRLYRVVIDPAQAALAGITLTSQFATAGGGNVLNDSNGFIVLAGSPETVLGSQPIAVGSIVALVATQNSRNDHSFDFGFVTSFTDPRTASLGDRVFVDTNSNGIQNDSEGGASGVTVQLLDKDCVAIPGRTAVTDGSGNYLFTDLTAGTYGVQFTDPSGRVYTTKNAPGSTVDNDSNADATGKVCGVVLAAGQSDRSIDAGLIPPVLPPSGKLGDRVFLDANRNGLQDEGEVGVDGATVYLETCGGAPIFNLTTIDGGRYEFSGLGANQYRVRFALPQGYDFTTRNVGTNGAIDSDADATTGVSACVTLAVGETNLTIDAGLVAKPTVTTTTQPGVTTTTQPGVTTTTQPGVTTTTQPGVTTTTQPGVATTTTPATTTTQPGVTTTTQPGVTTTTQPGVTTTTTPATTTTQPGVTTTTTPATTTTQPGVTTTTTPATTTTTTPIVTTTTRPATTTTTTPGPLPAKLGDRVFFDANRNGIQDPGEIGLPGVRVTLETCGGVVLATTVTIADGRYEFANLPAGQYRVRFDLPAGYDFTSRSVGIDGGLDSDADQVSGITNCVTLVAGQTNADIDAGVVLKPTIIILDTTTTTSTTTTIRPATTTTAVPTSPLACIGDKVFEGKAGDRDGKGIPGITLVLVNEDGSTVTTTTDANGNYRFCTMKPGTYTVRITVPPVGMTNIYTLDGKNNNATSVKLEAGKDNLDADFGYQIASTTKPTMVQVLPETIDSDFPETPTLTPVVTGSNGTRQGLAGLALILTGFGLVGLLRSRKERWSQFN